jgi:transcriptional regulator with XRE-family HTH domain
MFCPPADNTAMHPTLGDRITTLLDRRGLSHNEIARRCGIKQPSISRIIKGEQMPKLDTLQAIARHLHVSVAQLIGEAPLCEEDETAHIMHIMQELPPYKKAALVAAAESLSKDP